MKSQLVHPTLCPPSISSCPCPMEMLWNMPLPKPWTAKFSIPKSKSVKTIENLWHNSNRCVQPLSPKKKHLKKYNVRYSKSNNIIQVIMIMILNLNDIYRYLQCLYVRNLLNDVLLQYEWPMPSWCAAASMVDVGSEPPCRQAGSEWVDPVIPCSSVVL